MDNKVKEIEERLKHHKETVSVTSRYSFGHILPEDIDYLLSRIKELEEGIKRHREDMWGVSDNEISVGHPIDEELYKLVEK